MELLFLGTGAADWKYETDKENPEYRRNSSFLVNGELLIDPGPVVLNAIQAFGAEISKIKYIINTHPHQDHYNDVTVEKLLSLGAEIKEIDCGETKAVGKYQITALKANHSIPAKHYLIDDGEKCIFYGLDGSWLQYDEFQALMQIKPQLAVLDATVGFGYGKYSTIEHNNLRMVIDIKKLLEGYVDRFVISHLSKTMHTDHKTVCENMSDYGIEVAFDGLKIEI